MPLIPQPEDVTPPIPDSDGDGALTIKDILAALRKEKSEATARTQEGRAHGVLETLGLRQLAAGIRKVVAFHEGYRGRELPTANLVLAAEVKKAIAIMTERMEKNPEFRNLLTRRSALHALQKQHPLEEVPLFISDQHSLLDLAQKFDVTFPKGMRLDDIKDEEFAELLGHFGGIPPLAQKPKVEQTNNPTFF